MTTCIECGATVRPNEAVCATCLLSHAEAAKTKGPRDMATLHLPLRGEYFDQIKSGEKVEEYRLVTPFWTKRLEGRDYDQIELTKGYPPKDDTSRRIARPWLGYRKTTITHPHFGPDPVDVYAIRVN